MVNFDFRPIAEKYPKAFALLVAWFKNLHPASVNFYERMDSSFAIHENDGSIGYPAGWEWGALLLNPLELDFFFDEEGVRGIICDDDGNFEAEIFYDGYQSAGSYITRSEALVALWQKEFEILESKLSA